MDTSIKRCPKCEGLSFGAEEFCGKCGKALVVIADQTCSGCGVLINLMTAKKFCVNCGGALPDGIRDLAKEIRQQFFRRKK